MKRALAPLLLFCLAACAEEADPPILTGANGACGSVVKGVVPEQVQCPSDCPVAVKAFRVRDQSTCERSANDYVACINPGEGAGNPGAAFLDTDEGMIFVDDPSFDCSDGAEGCVAVGAKTRGRWNPCSEAVDGECDCACVDGTCPADDFNAMIAECNLPSPCDPLTGDASPSEETLQCYLDVLADGGPIKVEYDVVARHHITGQNSTARRTLAINGFEAYRVDSIAFDRPVAKCELQNAGFFLMCDPEQPTSSNIEDEDGNIERLPCSDPRAWVTNCEGEDFACPS